jgi:hypothetical protein
MRFQSRLVTDALGAQGLPSQDRMGPAGQGKLRIGRRDTVLIVSNCVKYVGCRDVEIAAPISGIVDGPSVNLTPEPV